MNITNSNVNEPDSNFHLLSLVDGPNIHVFNGRKKPEHLEETHTDKGEHANSMQKRPAPAGIEPRTLLILHEQAWIRTKDLLAVRLQC